MDTNGPNDPLLNDASTALFRLGRVFSRQPMSDILAAHTGRAVELSRIMVVQAIELSAAEAEQEVTIGTVADHLGIDPSTASRLVAETIRERYVERAPSEHDARRARLVLTERGSDLARDARRYQRTVFDTLTQDWTMEERHEFARLFVRFAHAVREKDIRDGR